MPHVLVAGPLHEKGVAMLDAAKDLTYEITEGTAETSYAHRVGDADLLLIRTQPLTAATVAAAKKLRFVSRHGVGYDAIDAGALAARGIPLAIVGDVNSAGVAEHAMMMMLAAVKIIGRADASARGGDWEWRNKLEAGEITGKNLLIAGYGRIGRKVAALGQAFGMTVRAYDPFLARQGWPDGQVRPVTTLDDGLAWADAISLHLPKSDAPLIGARELGLMKPSAVLVNTSRGGIVDEDALAEVLRTGGIRAAGIDVLDREPPAPDHPLFGLDNVVLTPHIAGLTLEGSIRLAESSVQNILDFIAGRLDPGVVVNGVPLDG